MVASGAGVLAVPSELEGHTVFPHQLNYGWPWGKLPHWGVGYPLESCHDFVLSNLLLHSQYPETPFPGLSSLTPRVRKLLSMGQTRPTTFFFFFHSELVLYFFVKLFIKNILINVCVSLSSGNAQYQESISSSLWRVFILLSKNLDQFPPFYSLRFQMPWKIPMSFFNATTWFCK